jgi:MoaA/NifB/PqqE/SkfB family radical SAM enzyme
MNQPSIKNKQFKRIYIEITNICNLRCSFCPPETRTSGYMKTGEFSRILDEIKPYTDYVNLHVKGEPLLHPELDKILDFCHEKGFFVNITTNGIRILNVKEILFRKPALRQINFSLHSFDSNPGQGDKKGYLADIFSFIRQALAETKFIISLRLWNLESSNENNIMRQRNKEITSVIEKEFDIPFLIEDKITPGKGIKLAERLFLNYEKQFSWPHLNDDYEKPQGFCYGLREHAAILVDGTVIPCCLDGDGIINLGNIFEKRFSDIIRGGRAVQIYDGFSNRKSVEILCRKCSFKERFDWTEIMPHA